MKKLMNGNLVDMTPDEISAKQAQETAWNKIEFDRAMANLRTERNFKLAETDYLALSDQTLSADMNTYRQQLRDITNGLTTVEDVESVVFPTKPTE